MPLTDKTQRLFEYISCVYAIDLPVDRDVTKYGAELWWQADIVQSAQCKIKEFHAGNDEIESDDAQDILSEDIWLSVTKRKYDDPPELPNILKDWVNPSSNPTKLPTSKPSIFRTISFDSDSQRVTAFKRYIEALKQWEESKTSNRPRLPENLMGWLDESQSIPIESRDFEERFDNDKNRVTAFHNYIEKAWKLWAERVLPSYKANILYDELFSLRQRLSVEGDRIEIVWGHLFLSWNHSAGNTVYHPLILTPMNLQFDPIRRNISLTPSQTIPTKLDLDCLINLDYLSKDDLLKYTRLVNSAESPPDGWNHNQMKGFAGTITGYLSKESAEKTNLYTETPCSRPSINNHPTIYNASLIFVRERTRRLWVDDAKKVADSIYAGANVPPFICALIADSHSSESPNPEDYIDRDSLDEDDGENLLPLEYNAQQKEIVDKLKKHFAVLVQGPPGTGKSHTIANIVSSLLARGKKVLVTSQTENALKVLRDYIPKQIQSLCVSQLGSDTESKIQLNEAVDSIGKHLDKKNSQIIEQNIQQLKKELRAVQEEQSRLLNQIKGWIELDSCTIMIGGQKITAQQAAKECSENESNHSWFPDKLLQDDEPPLTEQELIEMCNLLKEISPADRKSCIQYLPDPKQLLSPEDFSNIVSELQSHKALSSETEELRNEWGNNLHNAERMAIKNAINLLEDALRALQEMKHPWQFKVLEFMVSEAVQDNYWRDFYNKISSYRDNAWQSYQLSQGYEIAVDSLLSDTDITVALEELNRHVEKGRNPSNLFVRIRLSKAARLLYESIKVDGANLNSSERINVTKAYFTYKKSLQKIDTLWRQTISSVNGPELDLTCPMPLSVIDENIKAIYCPIDWKDRYLKGNKTALSLSTLGCRKQIFHKHEALEEYLKTLHGQIAEIEKCEIEEELSGYQHRLYSESKKDNSHNLWRMLANAVGTLSSEQYKEAYNELIRLLQLRTKVERLEALSSRLKKVAPKWYDSLEKKAVSNGSDVIEKDWLLAWRWRCLNEWLIKLHSRESVEDLQNRLERARRKERELIGEIVVKRTWQRQIANVEDHHYKALTAWADAMRLYGKGTGKYAQRHLSSAAKAMVEAVKAVPAWIMPLHRVVQSFPAKPEIFDVVIVDEASQCDLRALPVLFRGKKVLVVGDPEQISPSHIGVDESKVFDLIRQFLSDIPYADTTFLMKNSLYDITKTIPSIDRILLTEHFRCVPSIIEFNNHLCPTYDGNLEPLRQPNPQEMLDPPIITIFIENGFKDNNDVNKPEAEALVDMLIKCCEDERYSKGGKNNRKRTMGVISLLGEKQAKYISELISQRLDETEIEERRIICGDAYAFQGDERDVMFLSLVIAPNAQFRACTMDSDRQRFNVATSRARDQVFLFHSVRLNGIENPECVRYKLLSWYQNPPIAEMEAGKEVLRRMAESQFEIDVGERIIDRGYKVIPQFQPLPNDFRYRIDLVVQGEKNRVAIECDGDRYHGPENWEHDQRREAQLRRVGWKFWRISGSAFYRNKEQSLESLWQFLESEGIEPILFTRQSESNIYSTTDFKSESIKEDINRKSNDETEKKDYPQSKSTPIPLTPQKSQPSLFDKNKIPPMSTNWRVWLEISEWGKKTMAINEYWWNFAKEISIKLKEEKEITPKHRDNMNKCWKTAFNKGFSLKEK